MNDLKNLVVMAFGGGLTIVSVTKAFGGAGLNPDLRMVFGWSLMVILGLYLVGWGLLQFLLSSNPENEQARPSLSGTPAIDTEPSSGSNAKRRKPSNEWYDSSRQH